MNTKPNIFEQQKQIEEMDKIMRDVSEKITYTFDRIVDDIQKQRDAAINSAFVKQIGKLLKDNGVIPHFTEHEAETDDPLTMHYGVVFDHIDFSEHDKKFLKERALLESRIRQLENENRELRKQIEETIFVDSLPYDPIEVVATLITASSTYETSSLQRALGKSETDTYNIYDVSDLRQIAEHLLVYCNNN